MLSVTYDIMLGRCVFCQMFSGVIMLPCHTCAGTMNVRSWDGNNDSSVHEDEEENDSEAEEQLEDDELEEDAVLNMERELSIVAVPPKVVPHEENLLEASSSPAFHILDAVSVMLFLKMICNDLLVVKVNCWSYVFNIMKYI